MKVVVHLGLLIVVAIQFVHVGPIGSALHVVVLVLQHEVFVVFTYTSKCGIHAMHSAQIHGLRRHR